MARANVLERGKQLERELFSDETLTLASDVTGNRMPKAKYVSSLTSNQKEDLFGGYTNNELEEIYRGVKDNLYSDILSEVENPEYKEVKNLKHNGKEVDGLVDFGTGEIFIDKNISEYLKAATYVHELVHKYTGIKNEGLTEYLAGRVISDLKTHYMNTGNSYISEYIGKAWEAAELEWQDRQEARLDESGLSCTHSNVAYAEKQGKTGFPRSTFLGYVWDITTALPDAFISGYLPIFGEKRPIKKAGTAIADDAIEIGNWAHYKWEKMIETSKAKNMPKKELKKAA